MASAVAVRPVVGGVAPLPKAECRISVADFDRRAELKRLAAEWAERTAIEQDLPATIEDEATLQEVATLLCAERDDVRRIRTDAPTLPCAAGAHASANEAWGHRARAAVRSTLRRVQFEE